MLICLQFQIKDPIVIIRGFRLRKLDIERVLYLDFGNPRLYVIALYAFIQKIYKKRRQLGLWLYSCNIQNVIQNNIIMILESRKSFFIHKRKSMFLKSSNNVNLIDLWFILNS